jgi:hypothetical protein
MNTGHLVRRGRQHALPLFIDRLDESGSARLLDPIRLDRGEIQHDEGWLQKLIFRFPQVLPVHELEPGFSRLVPVCLELPTPAGYVDNLYLTGTGDLVMVECKLWRNPEARREVVAQIIDYANGMASWTYTDLQDAVQRASTADAGRPASTLYELVEEAGETDEAGFVDAVSRNLRLGRILLLIVGDGIREGVESLWEFLQLHAGFHFTLGIVEMPVFRLPDGGFIVQPRVLARTVNIERGIVRMVDGHTAIEAPTSGTGAHAVGRRTSISQDRLLELLAKQEPNLPAALQSFMDRAKNLGVVLEAATKSLQIRWQSPDDLSFALAGISERGELLTYNVNWVPDGIGHIELAHEYLEKIAALIGGEVRKTVKPANWHVALKGTVQNPMAITLIGRQEGWITIIEDYIARLETALLDARGGQA